MAKFDAGTAVEALEYDFTAYGGSAGVIPEPSTAALDDFFEKVSALGKTLGLDSKPGQDASAVAAALEKSAEKTGEDAVAAGKRMSDQMKGAVADLCGGTPSREEIDRLPYRVTLAFFGWLVGSLRPEAATPGTKV